MNVINKTQADIISALLKDGLTMFEAVNKCGEIVGKSGLSVLQSTYMPTLSEKLRIYSLLHDSKMKFKAYTASPGAEEAGVSVQFIDNVEVYESNLGNMCHRFFVFMQDGEQIIIHATLNDDRSFLFLSENRTSDAWVIEFAIWVNIIDPATICTILDYLVNKSW